MEGATKVSIDLLDDIDGINLDVPDISFAVEDDPLQFLKVDMSDEEFNLEAIQKINTEVLDYGEFKSRISNNFQEQIRRYKNKITELSGHQDKALEMIKDEYFDVDKSQSWKVSEYSKLSLQEVNKKISILKASLNDTINQFNLSEVRNDLKILKLVKGILTGEKYDTYRDEINIIKDKMNSVMSKSSEVINLLDEEKYDDIVSEVTSVCLKDKTITCSCGGVSTYNSEGYLVKIGRSGDKTNINIIEPINICEKCGKLIFMSEEILKDLKEEVDIQVPGEIQNILTIEISQRFLSKVNYPYIGKIPDVRIYTERSEDKLVVSLKQVKKSYLDVLSDDLHERLGEVKDRYVTLFQLLGVLLNERVPSIDDIQEFVYSREIEELNQKNKELDNKNELINKYNYRKDRLIELNLEDKLKSFEDRYQAELDRPLFPLKLEEVIELSLKGRRDYGRIRTEGKKLYLGDSDLIYRVYSQVTTLHLTKMLYNYFISPSLEVKISKFKVPILEGETGSLKVNYGYLGEDIPSQIIDIASSKYTKIFRDVSKNSYVEFIVNFEAMKDEAILELLELNDTDKDNSGVLYSTIKSMGIENFFYFYCLAYALAEKRTIYTDDMFLSMFGYNIKGAVNLIEQSNLIHIVEQKNLHQDFSEEINYITSSLWGASFDNRDLDSAIIDIHTNSADVIFRDIIPEMTEEEKNIILKRVVSNVQ